MPQTQENFYNDAQLFAEKLSKQLTLQKINIHPYKADHICFRCESQDDYSNYKSLLNTLGQLLTESPVNGRLISTFKLNKPIESTLGDIALIELPAPKAGKFHATGFEHVEFVLSESIDNFHKKHPHLVLPNSKHKILNQEFEYKLAENMAVKFHYLPLDRVISIEQSQITDVIFDMDGTLINSRREVEIINQKTVSALLARPVTLADIKTKPAHDYPTLFKSFGIEDHNEHVKGVQLWSEFALNESSTLFPGIMELLEKLKLAGKRLHLWTAREGVSTQKQLEALQIAQYFQSFCHWTPQHAKPKPSNFLEKNPNINPKQCLLIGDSTTDMKAAKNFGCIAGVAQWDEHVDLNAIIAASGELFFKNPMEVSDFLC